MGLGLAVGTLLFFIGSSGLVVGWIPLVGVTVGKFYALIGAGGVLIAASVIFRRRAITFPRPGRYDLLVLLFMTIQAGLTLLFFTKYPIFPEYSGVDFGVHVNIVQGLLSSGSSMPGGILYYGVHYQLALGVLLTGGTPIVVVQRIGAILAILGTPIVFLATSRIFSSKEAGLISSCLYSLTATVWFASLFDTGLYPNFFGVLASLFLLACVADYLAEPNFGRGVGMAAATGMLFLSHYSSVAVIPAIVAVPLLAFVLHDFKRRQLVPLVFVLLPAISLAAIFPHLFGVLLGFIAQAGGNTVGSTFLSTVLSPWPVLANMALLSYYDIGFVIMVAFAIVYAAYALKQREVLGLTPVAWFVSIIVAAPFNAGSWRIAYVGLVPLTLMAARGLARLLPSTEDRGRKKGLKKGHRDLRRIAVALSILILIAGSWGATMLSDSVSDTQLSSNSQHDVFNAITWLGSNSSGNSGFLSVSDWRFTYTTQLIRHDTVYQYFSSPGPAVAFARSKGLSAIIVTKVVTLSLPPDPSFFPWNNFPIGSNGNLTLLYSNDDVRIYGVK